MSTDKSLLDQIDDLVASKTFNLDALEGIKAIKDSLQSTLNERDRLKKQVDDLLQKNSRQFDDIELLSARLTEQAKQVDAMRDAVAKGNDAVWEKKVAEASAGAYKDAMAMVFKPHAVRETVQRNVVKPVEGHPGSNGSYPTPGYLASGTESESVTREDA
jgi:uncharacterized protein YoxC